MYKTIGGDRLGSGNKMKTKLHNYERSTHNLSNVFRSTMAPGVLVPFYKKVGLNGDTWTINLKTMVRTMPAIGPLFGTYKLQMDVFSCPMRLYNGILHNNWTRIGRDMSKVKLPVITMTGSWINSEVETLKDIDNYQISTSSLAAYLGIRGIGGVQPLNATDNNVTITRDFNAIPFLAYYDIFKNYYANKQEKRAQVITVNPITITNTEVNYVGVGPSINNLTQIGGKTMNNNYTGTLTDGSTYSRQLYWELTVQSTSSSAFQYWNWIRIDFDNRVKIDAASMPVLVFIDQNDPNNVLTIAADAYYTTVSHNIYENTVIVELNSTAMAGTDWYLAGIAYNSASDELGQLKIQDFDLENIDRMRQDILQNTSLGTAYNINTFNYFPYKAVWEATSNKNSYSKFKMAGLMLKTYQSDLFNNWLDTEFIDGINGIAAMTAVDTSAGYFTMDALNLSEKFYNLLNRVAVSDGSYQDWQEVVYGEDAVRMVESPIYCGGMSATIAFEEVVSTADTETKAAGDQALGSLAGKGTLANAHGGHIEIHVKEPSYIIGIVSITPYIDYSQGNDWDMTELESINDLHKPALDGIGFQNLMLEQAAWWGTELNMQNATWVKNACGKVPAWINYMTSVNQVYGDFAIRDNLGFMCLTRKYEHGQGLLNGSAQVIPVTDFTTYINPTKYNYQFADSELDAQNFWVQIGIDAIARRKMSAKIIPNL